MPHPSRPCAAATGNLLAGALLLAMAVGPTACRRSDTVVDGMQPAADVIRFDRNGDRIPLTPIAELRQARGDRDLPLPADFPADVYLPGDYAIHSVMDMPGTRVVSMLAPGHVPAMSDDARQAMAGAGWTPRMRVQHSADNAVLAFDKGRRSALFAFNRHRLADGTSDDGVVVSVQLQDRGAAQ
ncbi:hypothetical protein LDO26_12945 [Luteimonas sp. BDR2-5]|uniref:hypothetical protein n=1 Tax=Proluteimonas luteida TaxID=2878685 RepID=UPI001E617D4A|nr:hypothetical protein [Luteimonas sp. BDR2-5]MCD9029107.1 hypothetical protein [Luteimonas sp. BDR2-5]